MDEKNQLRSDRINEMIDAYKKRKKDEKEHRVKDYHIMDNYI